MNAPLKARASSTPSLSETFAGKHIVATGVTGFLGKVWIAMLLDQLRDIKKLTLVIRGKKDVSAAERFQTIFESSPVFRPMRAELGQEIRDLMEEKVVVVEAKLVEPLCGLQPSEAKRMMSDVDVVVHFAGLTDFEPDPIFAINANIHGAKHAADLAALSPSGRYVHVSTCFVAGLQNGDIPEHIEVGVSPTGVRFDPAEEIAILEAGIAKLEKKKDRIDFAIARGVRLGWPNIYTFSKGLSEHLLEARTDIRQTTFRPAIVECAETYPFPGWNEGINTSGPIVWLLGTSFQRFPAKPNNHFDVVPVDMVSRCMLVVVAAALRDEAKSIYHCASSHQNPLNFERAVELTGLGCRQVHAQSDDAFERNILRRVDAICHDPDRPQVLGFARLRDAAKGLRGSLRKFDLADSISPKLYRRIDGDKRNENLKELSMKCRTADRKLTQVEDMLRQYRPFIHDLRYTFITQNLADATNALSDEDARDFGFNIEALCWRTYWLKVQIPGLEKWSIPLLRGDKVPEDPPLPAREATTTRRNEHSSESPARVSA